MATLYHYHRETGELIGQSMADPDPMEPGRWLIPANATTLTPPAPGPGQFPAWNGADWVLRDLPQPAPEPAPPPPQEPPPEPTPYVPSRAEQIKVRLSMIDMASIRPARAVASSIAAGQTAPAFDAAKLASLETEAAALRAELAGLAA